MGLSGQFHSLAALFLGKEYPVQFKRKLGGFWSLSRDLQEQTKSVAAVGN
jgi:hypothetical protein